MAWTRFGVVVVGLGAALGIGCQQVIGWEDPAPDPTDRDEQLNGCKRPVNLDVVAPESFSRAVETLKPGSTCFLVPGGTRVSFLGDLEGLPVHGGDVWNGIAVVDPNNPITKAVVSAGELSFEVPANAHTIPFYVDVKPEPTAGAIFVLQ